MPRFQGFKQKIECSGGVSACRDGSPENEPDFEGAWLGVVPRGRKEGIGIGGRSVHACCLEPTASNRIFCALHWPIVSSSHLISIVGWSTGRPSSPFIETGRVAKMAARRDRPLDAFGAPESKGHLKNSQAERNNSMQSASA